ncbi:MAG: glycosyltransferase [Flavobacterium sp.]|nr:MAG: glycosyltransferase [Flavobacterium sp.]
MILLDSIYINNSGGKVLLDYLVDCLYRSDLDVFYLFDSRCSKDFQQIPEEKKLFLKKSLFSRHQFYKRNSDRFTKVFCFGNIPPTIRLNATVYTYFHNLVLLQQPRDFSFRKKLDSKFKAFFIQLNIKNTDHFIVQSENVKNALENYYGLSKEKILVFPFFSENKNVIHTKVRNENDFVFISDGNQHKNHDILLKAWKIVNTYKPEYKLHLTISHVYPTLRNLVETGEYSGYNILNHGRVAKEALTLLLSRSMYVVYPSLMESFGLGLIEGCEAGCEVIAANRPYVHSVIKPLRTFEPLSAEHIAYTVLNTEMPTIKTSKLKIKDEISALINLLKEESCVE